MDPASVILSAWILSVSTWIRIPERSRRILSPFRSVCLNDAAGSFRLRLDPIVSKTPSPPDQTFAQRRNSKNAGAAATSFFLANGSQLTKTFYN